MNNYGLFDENLMILFARTRTTAGTWKFPEESMFSSFGNKQAIPLNNS